MNTLRNILTPRLTKKVKSEDGLETIEFMMVFFIFFAISMLIVQVSIWFINGFAVNAALVDASQRASARGGLTAEVNNRFIDNLPATVCPSVVTTAGIKSCSNATLTSQICTNGVVTENNVSNAVDGCHNDNTAINCGTNSAVATGDECSKYGDLIKLKFAYEQPWLIDFGCTTGVSSTCEGSNVQPLDFSQSLLVGSQSLIGQNKK